MTTNYHHHHQCQLTQPPPSPPPTTYHCHVSTPPPPPITTCHCHVTQPSPPPPTTTTTCHCTLCYTTTHHHPPPQTRHHVPPQTHHTHQENYHFTPTHQNHHLYKNHTHHHQEEPNPTVTSLIHRISALETTLRPRHRHHSPHPSTLRHAAATTIQTHFRSFLIQRSKTLRHLKELAFIKSSLNNLKSFISNKAHFDSSLISRESLNLLIKLDSIQGNDPMIRDGKRSISRELVRFMEFIDEISNKNVILKREVRLRGSSGSRGYDDDIRKLCENLESRVKKVNEVANARKVGKVKKNVRFDEDGNVYRLIERKRGAVLSDGSESSNGDDEVAVEEIGVSSKETKVEEEEDSSEMSENEMDLRKNLGTRIYQTSKTNQPNQQSVKDDEDEEDDDDFVFSAPLPAKMEYPVASVSKKSAAKH